ncbi:MAG: hypothetical protein MUF42_03290 [Cytophagaceae bacterium]|jgi:hypothetical protein|nr:hypothetical protein [Cytophagaceae bacterium]
MRIYLLSILILASLAASGQFLEPPRGFFLEDSAKLGAPTRYSLACRHHKNLEILFPDSSSSYGPFEFISKEFYPTTTKDTLSYDSVVYTLRTFEIRETLELGLPVTIIYEEDTARVQAIPDQLHLHQYLKAGQHSIELKNNFTYFPVSTQFNYPYFILTLSGLSAIAWMLYKFLGASVIRNYRLYNIYRNHIQFIREFNQLKDTCEENPNIANIEKALVVWKEYLSKLEDEPIYTYTTTEIISLYNQDDLKKNLQEIDRSIYKGEISDNTVDLLDFLGKFSTMEYKRIREELQRGR